MENSLAAFSNHLVELVRTASPGIVAVNAGRRKPASGVVWRPGLVVTSHHAIREEGNAIMTADGTEHAAELVGRDPHTGLAVLRAPVEQTPARFHGGTVPAGALVLALGLRPEAGINASIGIVSSVRNLIHLDFSLYPGCSGGAAFDMEGAVIGIATMALTQAGAAAVPNATVDRVLDAVLQRGYVAKAYLGIGTMPVALRSGPRDSGLIVVNVEPDSPAERAGILLGDVLLGLGGRPTRQIADLQSALTHDSIGQQLTLSVIRAGAAHEIEITPAERAVREEN